MKKLKSETIQGVTFSFKKSPGDGVVASFGGSMGRFGDFVGLFNDKKEAIKCLKKSTIKKNGKGSITISNLKSIDMKKYYG